MLLRDRLLAHLRQRLGAVPLRVVLWDAGAFDFASAPAVTLTLNAPRLARHFLTGNMARLGEAYVNGELGVEGSVEDILRVGIALAERIGASRLVRGIAPLAKLFGRARRHSRARDTRDVRYHYDVSNEFYRLWLDRHMIYSCAYFMTGAENLDTAQEQKLDHLCRKLRLQPGERLLDIGCGWGGLLCWAAERYGVSAVGVTLAERQVEEARDRIAAAGAERYRIWRRYMPGMAYAFDRGWLSVAQIVAVKPLPGGPAPRPWTRAHQYTPPPCPPLQAAESGEGATPEVPLSRAIDWQVR